MRLVDADELMEHVWRDKLDSRELIAEMIDNAPTVKEIPTKIPIGVFERLLSMSCEEEKRPSTQTEPIRINVNETIKVKLTDFGKEIYYHQFDEINQMAEREICKPKFPKEDENGYTEFQLWCFIELYGEYFGMGMPNVIEQLEIVYER